jgi:crotonobetainyl-CoA:carnitine CoA-transferase CaiB-like acyl-CoA transferase
MNDDAVKPRLLEGIKIVDLTSVVFGPYCTQLLAEMGADVIKVEPPSGDIFRRAGVPAKTPAMGPCHMTLNRGKRSAVLDLKSPDDALLMHALIADADVFIHNVRGAAMNRLGFGYDALREKHPALVYVHCVGFGSGGPYSGLQAYDDAIQAASGMTSFMSRVDGNPQPRYVPSTIADKVAGMHAAYAVLAGVIHKLRTGEGQHIEVPMFECFTQFLYEEHLFGATFDPPTGPLGYARQINPARQPFPTSDGHVSIVPYGDESMARTFEVLGAPEVLQRPEFATPQLRMANITMLYTEIADRTPSRTTQEWVRRMNEAQVPAMAARDFSDIMQDPHLRDTGFFEKRRHPTEGAYHAMRPPVRFGAAPDIEVRDAPLLGEHTEALRATLLNRKP